MQASASTGDGTVGTNIDNDNNLALTKSESKVVYPHLLLILANASPSKIDKSSNLNSSMKSTASGGPLKSILKTSKYKTFNSEAE